jgi:hypothetical protein
MYSSAIQILNNLVLHIRAIFVAEARRKGWGLLSILPRFWRLRRLWRLHEPRLHHEARQERAQAALPALAAAFLLRVHEARDHAAERRHETGRQFGRRVEIVFRFVVRGNLLSLCAARFRLQETRAAYFVRPGGPVSRRSWRWRSSILRSSSMRLRISAARSASSV